MSGIVVSAAQSSKLDIRDQDSASTDDLDHLQGEDIDDYFSEASNLVDFV